MTGGRRLVAINAEHQGSGREQVAIDDQALGRWTPHHLYEASLKTLDFENCPCKCENVKGVNVGVKIHVGLNVGVKTHVGSNVGVKTHVGGVNMLEV